MARIARVSTATISRALNKPQAVSVATRLRVQQAIDASGYVPNLLAGGLASSRSRLVAALVPAIATSMFNQTIESMALALASAGYLVVLGLTGYEEHGAAGTVDALLARRPDALILTRSPTEPQIRRRLRASGVTIIETWDLPPRPLDVAIGFSHERAGRALADFVLERGYRRPLLITHGLARGRTRMQGFMARFRERGLRAPFCDLCEALPFAIDGRARLGMFLDAGRRADVVVCSSDSLAQEVMMEALARGLSVPGDLGVIGFGANEPVLATALPLTTVRIDGAEIGRRAAQVLLMRSQGREPPQRRIDVGFEILARSSA
ncbi:MAG TPA: LacI family DNA-binding transcriptional regulator [Steroidobacteraceae bacterium]|nr:LacI family DNA-binding transcriptional regulator [Steroidobacteraceae bacterium]